MLDGCVVAAEHLSKAKIEVNPAPEMRGAGENFTTGYITTYATVGYCLNEHWQLRAGAVNLQGGSVEDMVWSGFAGVSYLH